MHHHSVPACCMADDMPACLAPHVLPYLPRWEFKARHFDSTMLFKMGKFYEMFEMDAHVGVEVLGLMYMKVSTI